MAAMFPAQLAYRTVKFDEKAVRAAARHVLHLDASHGPSSVIAHGAQALFAELARVSPDVQVEHLRLWEDSTRRRLDYGLAHVQSKMSMLSGSGTEEDAQRFADIEHLAKQVASARALVVSAPMWNYGAPYVVKQYFDCVAHPGLTFRELPSGHTEGMLGGGRPFIIVTSSGGSASKDHLTPWLRDVAAMLGFDRCLVVSAPNVAHGDRAAVLQSIARSATEAAHHLTAEPSRPFSAGAGCAAAAAGASSSEQAAVARPVGARSQDGEEDSPQEWNQEGVLGWLRAKGGLSEDCLETVRAGRVDGELFRVASEDDWRSEEFCLEDADVTRIMELQELFLTKIGDVAGFGAASDR